MLEMRELLDLKTEWIKTGKCKDTLYFTRHKLATLVANKTQEVEKVYLDKYGFTCVKLNIMGHKVVCTEEGAKELRTDPVEQSLKKGEKK